MTKCWFFLIVSMLLAKPIAPPAAVAADGAPQCRRPPMASRKKGAPK